MIFVSAMLSTWRARVALAAAPLLGFALWSNTLTDHIGYGSALVSALFASVMGCLTGAGLAVTLRARGELAKSPDALLAAALGPVAVLALIAGAVLAHGLVAPACGPSHGALYWLLIPLPSAVLSGLVGYTLGARIVRKRWATGLAALVVPGFVLWSLVRFYQSPAIFAYDPFYGFFPGALYDEDVPLGVALVTYRLGTLGWIAALAAVNLWQNSAAARVMVVVGVLTGVGVYAAGPSLGHRSSVEHISGVLEGRALGARCLVIYDRSIDARQARATARDCDVRVAQLEDFFGVRERRTITVLFFANSAQKQALMGAADTYIAKPWRAEVYLQFAAFPHPVLKHELAHAVAAAMAPWPFHITTRGRLFPVPGLIEGAAVAAAWEGEGDATPHQWSRAMLEAGMAPRVRSLNGLGFFASASLTAYTAAGSFCRWLVDSRGRERFRALYASGDFAAVYGASLVQLEREWHGFLRTVAVSNETRVKARARFRRASIFGRQCPFEREAREREAALHLEAGELSRASRELAVLLERDPTDLRTRSLLAVARVRAQDIAGATALAREAGRVMGPAGEARVMLRVADGVWRWRGAPEALSIYSSLDVALFDEAEARTLSLKLTLGARGGAWAAAMRDLLVGDGSLGPSATVATARFSALWAETRDPLAAYLVARQYFVAERHAEVLALLNPETVATITDARVRAEATRIAAVSRYHSGDRTGAARLFGLLASDTERPMGERDEARDWLDRIARESR